MPTLELCNSEVYDDLTMEGTERSLTLPRSCSTWEKLGFIGVAGSLGLPPRDDNGTRGYE